MAVMLNKDMRQEIRKEAMKDAFSTELIENRIKLGKVCVEIHEKIMESIPLAQIPPEWHPRKQTSFWLRFPRAKGKRTRYVEFETCLLLGYRSDWHINATETMDPDRQWTEEFPQPTFYTPTFRHEFDMAQYKVPKKLQDKLLKASKALAKTEEERHQLDVSINAVLQSVRSVNQLLELWPDCKDYLPMVASIETKSLTIKIEDVNALLKKSKR